MQLGVRRGFRYDNLHVVIISNNAYLFAELVIQVLVTFKLVLITQTLKEKIWYLTLE